MLDRERTSDSEPQNNLPNRAADTSSIKRKAALRSAWYADGSAPTDQQPAALSAGRGHVSQRGQVLALAITTVTLLLLLGRTGLFPNVIDTPSDRLPMLVVVWMALLSYTFLALEYFRGAWSSVNASLVGILVSVFVAAVIHFGIGSGGPGWYLLTGAVLLIMFGAYLGATLRKLYPLQWAHVWRWLSNISTATLLSTAFVFFAGRSDMRTQTMKDAWIAAYSLSTSIIIGLFIFLRVGMFFGRLARQSALVNRRWPST